MRVAMHALTDMLMAGGAIQESIAGLTFANFQQSKRLQQLVYEELDNFRTSAYRLPRAYREQHSTLPFATLDQFDREAFPKLPEAALLWQFITQELPGIMAQCDELLHFDPYDN